MYMLFMLHLLWPIEGLSGDGGLSSMYDPIEQKLIDVVHRYCSR